MKRSTSVVHFMIVASLLAPAQFEFSQSQVQKLDSQATTASTALEKAVLGRYFSKSKDGKLAFKMPAPMLKMMHAEASTSSCSSSTTTSSSSSSSSSDSSTDLSACETKWSDYQSPSLGFYHNALCRLNNGYTASAENALCEFANVLGVDTSFSSLPVDVKNTINLGFVSYNLELKAEAPTEEFAIDAGYAIKATLLVNGAKYLVLYWDGLSSASKGFLIESNQGFMDKQGSYIQWDLSDPDNQSVRVLAANMASGQFLGPLQSGWSGSGRPFDTVLYGSVDYDSSSAEVELQYVEIKAQPRSFGNAIGCFKVFASGVKGGLLDLARSSNYRSGGVTSDTSVDATGMVGISIQDSTSSTESSGTALSRSDLASLVSFDKSCADLKRTSGAFRGSTVNFGAAPSDLF